MFTINSCYNKNIYYTTEEYKQRTGIDINIQAGIEKPNVHILAKTFAKDHLLYTFTRLECVQGLDIEMEVPNGNRVI